MLWKIFGRVINPGKIRKRSNISQLHAETVKKNIYIANEFNMYFKTETGSKVT